MIRPPSSYADKQTWTQRETVTTDGSGWWTKGRALAINAEGGLCWEPTWLDINNKGRVRFGGKSMLTLVVLGGAGVG